MVRSIYKWGLETERSPRDFAGRLCFFLLRAGAGLVSLQAGGMKLFGWFGGTIPNIYGDHPRLQLLFGVAGMLQFYGGAATILGLLTRPVAFLLSSEMAAIYFVVHFPHGVWPVQNHGELTLLSCRVFLLFAAHGAGDWSLDALIWPKKK